MGCRLIKHYLNCVSQVYIIRRWKEHFVLLLNLPDMPSFQQTELQQPGGSEVLSEAGVTGVAGRLLSAPASGRMSSVLKRWWLWGMFECSGWCKSSMPYGGCERCLWSDRPGRWSDYLRKRNGGVFQLPGVALFSAYLGCQGAGKEAVIWSQIFEVEMGSPHPVYMLGTFGEGVWPGWPEQGSTLRLVRLSRTTTFYLHFISGFLPALVQRTSRLKANQINQYINRICRLLICTKCTNSSFGCPIDI